MLEVIEPATEEVLAEVPRATAADVDAAVARAKAAWPAWRAVAPADRAAALRRIADAVSGHHEELTPLTALRFAELALEAGLPEGVVEVVAGPGRKCGARLVEHPDVAKIAFTGSTEVGRSIAAGAAGTIKRVTLELGGKSANVVFADADLEQAAAMAPPAVFGNAGQDCCARSRISSSAARWTASWRRSRRPSAPCAWAIRSTRRRRW